MAKTLNEWDVILKKQERSKNGLSPPHQRVQELYVLGEQLRDGTANVDLHVEC